jgi:hypothetical protein
MNQQFQPQPQHSYQNYHQQSIQPQQQQQQQQKQHGQGRYSGEMVRNITGSSGSASYNHNGHGNYLYKENGNGSNMYTSSISSSSSSSVLQSTEEYPECECIKKKCMIRVQWDVTMVNTLVGDGYVYWEDKSKYNKSYNGMTMTRADKVRWDDHDTAEVSET